jgi:hypothetical protein
MKDPLDPRQDPYQVFNDEARHQEKPLLVDQGTPPMEIRRIFGRLRGRANNPAQLEEARNQLTKTEYRLWTDIFFYVLGAEVELEKPLVEPDWAWEQALVPELFDPSRLIKPVLGDEEQLLAPIQFLEVEIRELPQYDHVYTPEWNITFPK